MEEDACLRRVVFTEAASEGLARCVGEEARKSKSAFYADTETFKAAVAEVKPFGGACLVVRGTLARRYVAGGTTLDCKINDRLSSV